MFTFQPRLGPKPFTPLKLNESDSFDKMFSVPVAPTCHTNGIHESLTEETAVPDNETAKIEEEVVEITKKEEGEEAKIEADQAPKTPSTAERRRLFETPASKETDATDNAVESGDGAFERNTVQRTSIAERRKMYENRSQSVQEGMMDKPDGSPSPLRRKDSFKSSRNDDISKSKSSSVASKTGGGDSQGLKKEIVATPTPKRTSTVFGKSTSN